MPMSADERAARTRRRRPARTTTPSWTRCRSATARTSRTPRAASSPRCPTSTFRNPEGRVIFSLKDYAFLAHEQAPDTVNPSLWRQARLNMNNGLFQVTDRIYQVRGFDISNMTIIEGSRGLIVIDPLVSTEVARARRSSSTGAHRGRKPVTAVIYTPHPRRPLRRRARRGRRGRREGRQRRHHRARPASWRR